MAKEKRKVWLRRKSVHCFVVNESLERVEQGEVRSEDVREVRSNIEREIRCIGDFTQS